MFVYSSPLLILISKYFTYSLPMPSSTLPFYIGLPQWQHASWSHLGLCDLADYSRLFNCVEGNTTFYALPKQESVQRWRSMTSDNFRFCFKFPSSISHQAALLQCETQLSEFFRCLSPIEDRIGQLWLQLPSGFGPEQLPRLWAFFDSLPDLFSYGIEVRHPAFFAKGEAERQLNQGLHQRGINRAIMDSRPVHSAEPTTAAIRDAQQKKPKVPVHALATAQQPIIRFIGGGHLPDNQRWFSPWEKKIAEWRKEQRTPFLFIHTPDNSDSPQQALTLWQDLHRLLSDIPPAPHMPEQSSLF